MVGDTVSTVLEDFEKNAANLWYMVDPDDVRSMMEVACSARCDMMENYLYNLDFHPMVIMDDRDDGIVVILSIHDPTTLCAIMMIETISTEHLPICAFGWNPISIVRTSIV